MKMKRFALIALAVAALLSLASCGDESKVKSTLSPSFKVQNLSGAEINGPVQIPFQVQITPVEKEKGELSEVTLSFKGKKAGGVEVSFEAFKLDKKMAKSGDLYGKGIQVVLFDLASANSVTKSSKYKLDAEALEGEFIITAKDKTTKSSATLSIKWTKNAPVPLTKKGEVTVWNLSGHGMGSVNLKTAQAVDAGGNAADRYMVNMSTNATFVANFTSGSVTHSGSATVAGNGKTFFKKLSGVTAFTDAAVKPLVDAAQPSDLKEETGVLAANDVVLAVYGDKNDIKKAGNEIYLVKVVSIDATATPTGGGASKGNCKLEIYEYAM